MNKDVFGEGFSLLLSRVAGFEFSTADFIIEYQQNYPSEWAELERQFGPGGRGAGQYHTVFTRVAKRLSALANRGELRKLDYRPAPDWWGNAVVQFWIIDGPKNDLSLGTGIADNEFREGSLKLRTHLSRERAWSLSKRKKQAFKEQHGKLFCERCGLEPEKEFGEEFGGAVIEVHHAAVAFSKMGPNHRTKIDDLQCLCANCHRLTHAELAA